MESMLGATEEGARKLALQVMQLAREGQWDRARWEITVAQRESIEDKRVKPPLCEMALRDLLEMPLVETGLELRTVNHLDNIGVIYLRQLLGMPLEQLQAIPGVGPQKARDIFRELQRLGFDCSDGFVRVAQRAGWYWKQSRKGKP